MTNGEITYEPDNDVEYPVGVELPVCMVPTDSSSSLEEMVEQNQDVGSY